MELAENLGERTHLALLASALYLVAQLGQKLGAWQTFQLHTAYENAMGVSAPLR